METLHKGDYTKLHKTDNAVEYPDGPLFEQTSLFSGYGEYMKQKEYAIGVQGDKYSLISQIIEI